MTRKLYVMREGKLVEIGSRESEPQSHFVIGDEMAPLKNPVTGEIFTSKRAYIKDCQARGLEIAGNDLQSERKHKTPDILTDAKIMDAIERAESICNDSSKFRARQEENLRRLHDSRNMLGTGIKWA